MNLHLNYDDSLSRLTITSNRTEMFEGIYNNDALDYYVVKSICKHISKESPYNIKITCDDNLIKNCKKLIGTLKLLNDGMPITEMVYSLTQFSQSCVIKRKYSPETIFIDGNPRLNLVIQGLKSDDLSYQLERFLLKVTLEMNIRDAYSIDVPEKDDEFDELGDDIVFATNILYPNSNNLPYNNPILSNLYIEVYRILQQSIENLNQKRIQIRYNLDIDGFVVIRVNGKECGFAMHYNFRNNYIEALTKIVSIQSISNTGDVKFKNVEPSILDNAYFIIRQIEIGAPTSDYEMIIDIKYETTGALLSIESINISTENLSNLIKPTRINQEHGIKQEQIKPRKSLNLGGVIYEYDENGRLIF